MLPFHSTFLPPFPCLAFFLSLLKHSECLFSTISSTIIWFYQSIWKKVATILDRYIFPITTTVVLRSKAHPHVYYTLYHIRVMSIQPSGSISIAVRLRNTGCWHLSTSWFDKTEPFFFRMLNYFGHNGRLNPRRFSSFSPDLAHHDYSRGLWIK